MAIGYSSLISKTSEVFFNGFIQAIMEEFVLLGNDLKIRTVDDSGENVNLVLEDVILLYKETNEILIKFKNTEGNYISCSVKDLGGFVVENYSLEELLSDKEEEHVFSFVQRRYEFLRTKGLGIGFIFDPEGYSEDYIKIDYDAWGN
jgi:hypothetical protein